MLGRQPAGRRLRVEATPPPRGLAPGGARHNQIDAPEAPEIHKGEGEALTFLRLEVDSGSTQVGSGSAEGTAIREASSRSSAVRIQSLPSRRFFRTPHPPIRNASSLGSLENSRRATRSKMGLGRPEPEAAQRPETTAAIWPATCPANRVRCRPTCRPHALQSQIKEGKSRQHAEKNHWSDARSALVSGRPYRNLPECIGPMTGPSQEADFTQAGVQ